MNAPRIVSMTALAASLVFILFAMTQVSGNQPGQSDISETAQFCLELAHIDTSCSAPLSANMLAR